MSYVDDCGDGDDGLSESGLSVFCDVCPVCFLVVDESLSVLL